MHNDNNLITRDMYFMNSKFDVMVQEAWKVFHNQFFNHCLCLS